MAGKIPRQFIDELLVRVDIVDIIDSHVPLKKMGSNYTARCPFHNEKSPSFNVNRNKQFYHCFGCGAGGNVISFLMEFNHLSFVETIEELATVAGVEIPYENQTGYEPEAKNKLVELQEIMAACATFYTQQLKKHPQKQIAVEYLKNRGITGVIARDFMIGYAPDGWQILSPHFKNTELLCEAGMLAFKNDMYYDRFRQRIMFPIRNKRGHVIGFGGRVLDDSQQPKYLNSPETPLFHKSNEVYGLYELLKKNPKPARILIVEGYMDVVTLAQFGIDYSVAALGTNLTATQLQLLFRSTPEVILCFDGDNAGQNAAWKAMDAVFSVLNDNRQVRVLILPSPHDPDSLLREEGTQAFLQRIENAEMVSSYFFNHFTATLNLDSIEGRAKLAGQAKPFLLKLADGFFKNMMLAKLEELTHFDVAPEIEKETVAPPQNQHQKEKNVRHSMERLTLALLVQNPKLATKLEANPIDWQTLEFSGIDIFKAIVQKICIEKPTSTAQLLEHYRGLPEEKMLNALASLPILIPDDGIEAEFSGGLKQLILQGRKNRLNKLVEKEKTEGLTKDEKDFLRRLLQF
ncbi:MAG: DNA primase [Methylococcales bacterium]|nr:DNA primase [Methylococcales bacterium]